MRRGRIFIFLALILIIGLVIVAVVLQQFVRGGGVTEIPSGGTGQEVPTATVEIYVAGQNIAQGAVIREELLATIRIPRDNLPAIVFTVDNKDELLGKLAKYPIAQGVVITTSEVGTEDEIRPLPPYWTAGIDNGMTAMSIPTTRLSSVAFGAADGAHVNISACFLFVDVDPSFQSVLPNSVAGLTAPANVPVGEQPGITLAAGATLEGVPPMQGRTEVEPSFQQGIYVVPSEAQRPRLVCQMIAQNVKVLKLGNFPLQATVPTQTTPVDETAAQQQQQAQPTTPTTPDLITLMVTPQDSVTLSYLVYSGAQLTLSLRNASDEQRTATESTTLQYLLSTYNIQVPAKLPYALQPRIDELTPPFLPNDVVTVPPAQ